MTDGGPLLLQLQLLVVRLQAELSLIWMDLHLLKAAIS
jgi:hypothetical protein